LLNDTVCVVLTPLVVMVVVEAKLPPLPYVIALAAAANVGGVVSFSGNPQNMIVGAAAHGQVSFAHYLVAVLPVGIACLAVDAWLIGKLFDLPDGPLPQRELERPELDRALTVKAIAALALFAILALCGFALAGAAMVAAVLLIIASRQGAMKAFEFVDWPLLVFFAGLFVVVAGVQHAGIVDKAFHALEPVIARGDWVGDAAFILLIIVLSQVVSNVPIAVIAVAWVPHMPDPAWGYIMLAVASTLAGTLTPLGSVANIIVMEAAGEHGHIGFWKFLKYGLVITVANCAVAFTILGIERILGFV
ncbi:MAG TPA: SLC13 family permease, partial [Kofleriaceae bacterium]